MALIDYIDPINRNIHLSVDTMNIAWHPVDLYREVRALRGSDESLRAYDNFMEGAGNIDKGGGKATERYFILMHGTRIVPYDASHVIDVTGTLISDDGFEGAFCFDKTLLTPGVSVDIQYAPKQVEVINLNFDDLVFSSFMGGVWIDVNSVYGDIGTDIAPNGNRERPVNTIQLAVEIANTRGFSTLFLIGSLALGIGDDISGFMLIGQNPIRSQLSIAPEALTVGCEIQEVGVSGTLDGGTVIRSCIVYTLEYMNGFILDSALSVGTITLGGSNDAIFMRCVSGISGETAPIIDLGGAGQSLGLRDYTGSIQLNNKTGTDAVTLDMSSGKVIIDSTILDSNIVVRGSGKLINNSNVKPINEMINGAAIDNVHRLLELQRPHHTGTGDIWYWDPYAGDDLNDGDHVNRGVKTFAKAHELVTTRNHDIIICVSTDPSGTTTTTESIVVTKDYLFVRGAGKDFKVQSLDDNLDAINISGAGVEFSGMVVSTSPTNTKNCVYTTGDFTLLKDLWMVYANDGILIKDNNSSVVDNVQVHHNLGYGIKVSGACDHTDIIDCHIGSNGGDGVSIDITGHEVHMKGYNVIHKNSGYGVNISATSEDIIISNETVGFNNVLGQLNDLGINTTLGRNIADGHTADEVFNKFNTTDI